MLDRYTTGPGDCCLRICEAGTYKFYQHQARIVNLFADAPVIVREPYHVIEFRR